MKISLFYTNAVTPQLLSSSAKGWADGLSSLFNQFELEVTGFHKNIGVAEEIVSSGVANSHLLEVTFDLTTLPLYNNSSVDVATMISLSKFLSATFRGISTWTNDFTDNDHGTVLSDIFINPSDGEGVKYILPTKIKSVNIQSTDTSKGIDTPYKVYNIVLSYHKIMNYKDLEDFYD